MKISSYNSQKIKVLSFVAIMMVLYIHAVFSEAKGLPIASYVQGVLSFSGLSFVANPLFYCISGFLFFVGVTKVSDCYPKIKKRARTLLVPYIIWNIIFVLWYLVLGIIPGVSKFVNSDMTSGLFANGPLHTIYALFIAPAGFQLWYVRDLIIYVLLSPFFYICLKKFKWVLPVLLFFAGTLGLLYLPSTIKIWGSFFFVFGGYIALHSSLDDIHDKISPRTTYICLTIYLLNAIIRPLNLIPLEGTDMFIEICGLIAIWRLYDVFAENPLTFNQNTLTTNLNPLTSEALNPLTFNLNTLTSNLATLGSYSFFIYLFHEPAFNIIKKIGLKILGVHEWSLILLYLICPFIMAAFAIGIAVCLQKIMPKLYSILVGGR